MKFFYTILFSLLIFTSLMQPTNGTYHKLTLSICIGIIILTFILRKTKVKIGNSYSVSAFILYTIFSFVAALSVSDFSMFKNQIQLLLIFIAISVVFNSLSRGMTLDIVLNSVILAYIPFLILCFQQNRMDPFVGIYENSNVMGLSLVGLAIVIIMKLYLNLIAFINNENNKFKYIKILAYLCIYIYIIYVIMLTNSRTSLLAIGISTIFMLIFLIIKGKISFINILKFFLVFICITLALVISIMKIPAIEEALGGILSKFEYTSSTADVTSGRVEIWAYVLNNVEFWGHGEESLLNSLGVAHAHNTFLQILEEKGVIALFFYIVFFLFIVAKLILKSKTSKEDIFSIIVLVSFISISMFEYILYHVIQILLFIISAIITSKDESETNLLLNRRLKN